MLWMLAAVNDVVDIPLGKTSLRLFAMHSPAAVLRSTTQYGGILETCAYAYLAATSAFDRGRRLTRRSSRASIKIWKPRV